MSHMSESTDETLSDLSEGSEIFASVVECALERNMIFRYNLNDESQWDAFYDALMNVILQYFEYGSDSE